MISLWKNWTVHNLICHPVSEIAYWLIRPFSKSQAEKLAGVIHDSSIPLEYSEGRG